MAGLAGNAWHPRRGAATALRTLPRALGLVLPRGPHAGRGGASPRLERWHAAAPAGAGARAVARAVARPGHVLSGSAGRAAGRGDGGGARAAAGEHGGGGAGGDETRGRGHVLRVSENTAGAGRVVRDGREHGLLGLPG